MTTSITLTFEKEHSEAYNRLEAEFDTLGACMGRDSEDDFVRELNNLYMSMRREFSHLYRSEQSHFLNKFGSLRLLAAKKYDNQQIYRGLTFDPIPQTSEIGDRIGTLLVEYIEDDQLESVLNSVRKVIKS